MKSVFKIIIIFVSFTSTSLYAEKFFDGVQLFGMCQTQSVEMAAGCSMFIMGAAETLRMTGYSEKDYCLPDTITNQQIRNDLLVFLNSNRDKLKYSAASLFYASLAQNYPCKVSQTLK